MKSLCLLLGKHLPTCFCCLFFPPARTKPVKAPPKSHARGVVFEEVFTVDLEEDEVISEPKTKISLTKKSKCVYAKLTSNSFFFPKCMHSFTHPLHILELLSFLYSKPAGKASQTVVLDDTDNELDDKLNRLIEMFPQLTRPDALEVSLNKRFCLFMHQCQFPSIKH